MLPYRDALEVGGELAYRQRGEDHAWTPETVALLQHAVRAGDQAKYQAYSRRMNEQDKKLIRYTHMPEKLVRTIVRKCSFFQQKFSPKNFPPKNLNVF